MATQIAIKAPRGPSQLPEAGNTIHAQVFKVITPAPLGGPVRSLLHMISSDAQYSKHRLDNFVIFSTQTPSRPRVEKLSFAGPPVETINATVQSRRRILSHPVRHGEGLPSLKRDTPSSFTPQGSPYLTRRRAAAKPNP